jgi:hypothetical protein
MNCPKCGTLIFDAYTDEKRIRDLYKSHTVSAWASGQLKILGEMAEYHKLPDWYIAEVRRIKDGISGALIK